ncbi:hypothetical protein GDO86_002760 [Hymenochirus boettgeri]|uniref:SET domain-containing protein n=1 Tax=Hymenochirus boettgeri TaxID=247094 RepID=A0A8T2K2E5_9PIPI|nr:hypothetical protein GDO86_002760 [Hymenochirus boettgeri]
MVLRNPGDLIISLPEQCLITTEKVLESYLGKYIRVWTPPVSPLLALCTFLITERVLWSRSLWKPYLDTLPSTYSAQCIGTLFPVKTESVLTYDTFLWAWCTVIQGRLQETCPAAGVVCKPDVYAMAPFLDLLNHSPGVQVEAAFNEKRRCYEIRTINGCKKHNQVFIYLVLRYLPTNDKQLERKWSILNENDLVQ